MLKLQFKDGRREPQWLTSSVVTIGSAPQCDIVVEGSGIAQRHLELHIKGDDVTLIPQAGATTRVNGEVVKRAIPLSLEDSIDLFGIELGLLQPKRKLSHGAGDGMDEQCWRLVAEGDWLNGQSFTLPNARAIIGRDHSCEVIIPGTHLSRRHAELIPGNSHLLIRDLGSSNGTYINERKVSEGRVVPGDLVRFDVLKFRVHGPANGLSADDFNATLIRSTPAPAAGIVREEDEEDPNATQVRLVIPPTAPKPVPKAPKAPETPPRKQFRTRPTSEGNREDTAVLRRELKAKARTHRLWVLISASLALTTLAALAYLYLSVQ